MAEWETDKYLVGVDKALVDEMDKTVVTTTTASNTGGLEYWKINYQNKPKVYYGQEEIDALKNEIERLRHQQYYNQPQYSNPLTWPSIQGVTTTWPPLEDKQMYINNLFGRCYFLIIDLE